MNWFGLHVSYGIPLIPVVGGHALARHAHAMRDAPRTP